MYKHIMLAVNLQHRSSWKGSLPTALSLVERYDAKLHVITIVQDFSSSFVSSYFPAGYEDKLKTEARAQLKALLDEQVPAKLRPQIQTIIGFGSVEDEVINYVKTLNIDLLIMSDYRARNKKGMFGHPHITSIKNHIDCSMLVDRF